MAFDNSRDGTPTSLLLEQFVLEDNRTAKDVMSAYEGYALVSIAAGCCRRCQQGVARDPQPEEPAHAFVFGKKNKKNKACLATSATWVVPPCDDS